MPPKPQTDPPATEPPGAGGGSRAARLAASAGVVGAATLASRVLGLVRDQVLAYRFGAGDAMDAFNVASRIPNLMRDLFAEGAMSAAFVPTFMRRLTKDGRGPALLLGNQVVNALIAATGVVVVAASCSRSRWCAGWPATTRRWPASSSWPRSSPASCSPS